MSTYFRKMDFYLGDGTLVSNEELIISLLKDNSEGEDSLIIG